MRREEETGRPPMEAIQSAWHQYLTTLVRSCSGSSRTYRPGEELDNTKNTAGCSLVAAPGIVGVLLVFFTLKCILCPSKQRQLYAGSEDAPELEEIVSSGGGRPGRRVDSYAVRHGRLTVGSSGGGGSCSKGGGGSSGSGSGSSRSAPRPKKGGKVRAAECEPVLSTWRH